ncbi:MAG: ribosomal protein S18-alanine N-acetyltransferase [Bacillales bacterium]|nr:ribosomal protein S18-alanine N-acetyltransferase [Bacillales bacterium]
MEYRLANELDIDSLADLESKNFHSPWTKEQFLYEIKENEFSKTIVVYEGECLIGYINYWIIFDNGQINKICVKEDYRRKKIASYLLEKASEDFKKNECYVITLEVRVSNISAQKLYEKFGFKTILTKEGYYTDGEDAYYMIKGVY